MSYLGLLPSAKKEIATEAQKRRKNTGLLLCFRASVAKFIFPKGIKKMVAVRLNIFYSLCSGSLCCR